MQKYILLIILIALPYLIFAQDSSRSEAYKKNPFKSEYPLIKPKHPPYSLMLGYILQKKAKEKDALAEHELGLRYLLGRGFKPDTNKAVFWIKKAADEDLPAAEFNYGIMLNNGIGVRWNPFKSFDYFISAAKNGMPEAEYVAGLFYVDNLVVNRNLLEAYKWIKKAADDGVKEAKKTLLEFNKSGINFSTDSLNAKNLTNKNDNIVPTQETLMSPGLELDYFQFEEDSIKEKKQLKIVNELLKNKPEKLRKYLGIEKDSSIFKDTSALGLTNKAADYGSPEALLLLARLEENKSATFQKYIRSLEYYLESFRLGSQRAATHVVELVNKPETISILEKEVKNENPDAMYIWAALTAYNFDYTFTKKQAVKFLEKSATKNHIPSLIELGLLYSKGTGVELNKKKAAYYFKKAASLGSVEAKIRLVMFKILNNDKTLNLSKEISLLKKYNKAGSVLAETVLAYCYQNGKGVKKNDAEAVRLYKKASMRGSQAAYNSLKRMYDVIRPPDKKFKIYNE